MDGSGEIESRTAFNPVSLRLAVQGSGSIRIPDAATGFLDAEIGGSGKITMIEGIAENQSLKISGSGEMDFGNFIAKKSTARISGSGSIKLNVAEKLDVNISGSGSVRYRGNPTVTSSCKRIGFRKQMVSYNTDDTFKRIPTVRISRIFSIKRKNPCLSIQSVSSVFLSA